MKKQMKKLVLAKETVRRLEMTAVVAGQHDTLGETFDHDCDSVPRYRCRYEPSYYPQPC